MPRLILMMKVNTPKQVNLTSGRTTVGRAENNSLVLDSALASRAHAVIDSAGESAVITDLGSSNGTLVNGRKIQKHVLRNRDVIEIGDVQLRFLASSDTSPDFETLALKPDTRPGALQAASFAKTLMPKR